MRYSAVDDRNFHFRPRIRPLPACEDTRGVSIWRRKQWLRHYSEASPARSGCRIDDSHASPVHTFVNQKPLQPVRPDSCRADPQTSSAWVQVIVLSLKELFSVDMTREGSVAILGGGIIGLSIAYYLSQDPQYNGRIVIVDSADRLLESASGYAGGFLARDWFAEKAAALGNLSFNMHRDLAREHDGHKRWGYQGSHVYSLSLEDAPAGVRGEDWLLAGTSRAQSASRRSVGHVNGPGEATNADGTPAWITPQKGATWNPIASIDDCGQVEPRKLCEFLLEKCKSRGVQFQLGYRAKEIRYGQLGKASNLLFETVKDGKTSELLCSDVVVAAGCWTPRVWQQLFPSSPVKIEIDALAGHSVLYRTPRYTKPFINVSGSESTKDATMSYAIYCPPTKEWNYSPEAYARLGPNGKPEIWIGGLNNTSAELPLPELATDAKKLMKPERLKELRTAAVTLSGLKQAGSASVVDDLEAVSEGLCFRPVSKTGVPILQQIPHRALGKKGQSPGARVWVASGHGPWGISMSLGSGLVMSQLIQGRKPSVDISALQVDIPEISRL